ncbi:helix-turn-helix domain-containing protein [Orbaceae bacterium ESL0727]|nr:helix-turn-helix domain-containing protein [Orbaceae bacterium ESL0727]
MSIRLMTKAYESVVGDSGAKFVLVKLADNANDEGFCYPSNQYLVKHCEMSERTIQNHTKKLERLGLIKITERRGKSNLYQIMLNDATPVESAPRQICTPAKNDNNPRRICTTPPQNLRDTPAESAPITLNNPKESIHNHKKDDFNPMDIKPHNVSVELWGSWIDYRKKLGKKLQSASWIKQAQMLAAQDNPEEIINRSIMNGWQGLFPKQANIAAVNHSKTAWINHLDKEVF